MNFAKVDILAEERKRFLHYRPHAKQQQFHALGATCRERLFLAGNRVGKTFCGATASYSARSAWLAVLLHPEWV